MAEYELVRQIRNQCPNNQMRDVFFEEVETEDPIEYVRQLLKGKNVTLTAGNRADGGVTVFADCSGLVQEFVFTPV